jgi:arabinan endo-1,5-alpha-L-arabinosidase
MNKMKMTSLLLSAILSAGYVYGGARAADTTPPDNPLAVRADGPLTIDGPTAGRDALYHNPVSAQSLPDPTVIKAPDGYFYLYATEDLRGVPICRSDNLTDWTVVGRAFTDATRPDFESRGGIWAPDINYIDGRYVMYYSMSVWGGEWTCGIGAATADSPEGPFTDRGKLFRSNEIDVQNSIDPFYIEDGGSRYLVWGSFRGIYAIELTPGGLSVKEGAQKRQIAGTAFEGVYIHKRGGWYYMFASVGSCCEGVNSTYRLVVGRSRSLFGPYLDKTGRDMMENGYSVVVGRNSRFVGNGHCSEIVQDDAGDDWIFYHGVDTARPKGRVLMLDRVRWDSDEWPSVEGGAPALGA